jgi:hypothetical protein
MANDLRSEMPTVAAWIDELRAVFGAASINQSIRDGLQPGVRSPLGFFAEEGGHTLGQPNDMSTARVAVMIDDGSFPGINDCERKAREKKLVAEHGRSDRRTRSRSGQRSA